MVTRKNKKINAPNVGSDKVLPTTAFSGIRV